MQSMVNAQSIQVRTDLPRGSLDVVAEKRILPFRESNLSRSSL